MRGKMLDPRRIPLHPADVGNAADDTMRAIRQSRPGLARQQRPDFSIRRLDELFILIYLAGLKHQPVNPLEHIHLFSGNEIIVALADQVIMGMTHEIAHAAIQQEKARLFILNKNRMRHRIKHKAQCIGVAL